MSDPRHLPALLRLAPKGAWDLDEGGKLRELLAVFGQSLDDLEDQRDDLLSESRPQTTTAAGLLSLWEGLYRLLPADWDEATRLDHLLAAVRRVPDCRPATILGLVETWSAMDWDLIESMSFHFDEAGSVMDDDLFGPMVFILRGDHDTADALSLSRSRLEVFLGTLKPAHVGAVVQLSGAFWFDDALSVMDLDLFGED